MTNSFYELPGSCDFSVVGNNSELQSDCSPRLKDQFPNRNFQGILINSVPEIVWPKNVTIDDITVMPNGNADGPLKFIIAGLVNLPYNTLNFRGDFSSQLLVIAVDQQTAKIFSGKIIKFGFNVRPDTSEFDERQKNQDALIYFNIDLVQNLKVPIKNATYTVYATLGDYKSNVLTIKTDVK